MRKQRTGSSGFSLIEAVITLAVLLVIGAGISSWLSKARFSMARVGNKSDCQQELSSLINNIKAKENALVVRNWLPSGQSRKAPAHGLDPFCNGETRSKLCDHIDLYGEQSGRMDAALFYNSQNIRNSTTWALELANQFFPRACGGKKTFSGSELTELGNLLPDPLQMKDWVQSIQLTIEPAGSGMSCPEGLRLAVNDGTRIQVGFDLTFKDKETDTDQTCSATIQLGYARDTVPPVVSTAAPPAGDGFTLTNGAGQAVPGAGDPAFGGVNTCSCQQKWPLQNECQEMYSLSIEAQSNEAGSLFGCCQEQDGGDDCRDMPRGSSAFQACGTLIGGLTYNQPAKARFSFVFDRTDQGKTFQYHLRAYDVGRNSHTIKTTAFQIKKPDCSAFDPRDYPPGQGPNDGCNNRCPGTKSACVSNCPARNTYCPFDNVVDNCGDICPAGTKNCGGCDFTQTAAACPNGYTQFAGGDGTTAVPGPMGDVRCSSQYNPARPNNCCTYGNPPQTFCRLICCGGIGCPSYCWPTPSGGPTPTPPPTATPFCVGSGTMCYQPTIAPCGVNSTSDTCGQCCNGASSEGRTCSFQPPNGPAQTINYSIRRCN